jgi:hypothetical protein
MVPRDGVLVTNPFNERTCSGNLGMPLMSNVRFAELRRFPPTRLFRDAPCKTTDFSQRWQSN